MNMRSVAVGGVVLLAMIASAMSVHGAVAINQITNINNTPGFGNTNVFSNLPIGVDDTAVANGNDIVVYTLVGNRANNGAGLSVGISNGENGITSTNGGANADINNTAPLNPIKELVVPTRASLPDPRARPATDKDE